MRPEPALPDSPEEVTAALDRLPELMRRVLELRLGLMGKPLGLEETGSRLGLPPRLVGKLERCALGLLTEMLPSA